MSRTTKNLVNITRDVNSRKCSEQYHQNVIHKIANNKIIKTTNKDPNAQAKDLSINVNRTNVDHASVVRKDLTVRSLNAAVFNKIPVGNQLPDPSISTTGQIFYDRTTSRIYVFTGIDWSVLGGGSGGGDMFGPASSTNRAIAVFNGTSGKIVQNTGVTISAGNNINGVNNLIASGTVSAGTIDGNVITDGISLLENGYLELADIAAPAHAGNGLGRLYKKNGSDGLYWLPDAAGTEVNIGIAYPPELQNLTTAEIQQLENIGTSVFSVAQWAALSTMQQSLADLTAGEVTQLKNIDTSVFSIAQWAALSTLQPTLADLTPAEIDQLKNIDTSVFSAAQWAALSVMPQELQNLTTAEIQQLENIGTSVFSAAQWTALSTLQPTLADLTAGEIDQLKNIDTSTFSIGQWAALSVMPQELQNLTTAEIQQLENIGTSIFSAAQWAALSTLQPTLADLTAGEIDQLKNIDTSTFSISQWAALSVMPQELQNLTTAEIQQLENIGTSVFSAAQWTALSTLQQTLADLTAGEITQLKNIDTSVFSVAQWTALSTLQQTLADLTAGEVTQLKNIDTSVFSAAQWTALSTLQQTLADLTAGEVTQLKNIDTSVFSAAQWTALSTLQQTLADLTAGEVTQLKNIDATVISATQWGYIGSSNQATATSSAVIFNTVNATGGVTGKGVYSAWSTWSITDLPSALGDYYLGPNGIAPAGSTTAQFQVCPTAGRILSWIPRLDTDAGGAWTGSWRVVIRKNGSNVFVSNSIISSNFSNTSISVGYRYTVTTSYVASPGGTINIVNGVASFATPLEYAMGDWIEVYINVNSVLSAATMEVSVDLISQFDRS